MSHPFKVRIKLIDRYLMGELLSSFLGVSIFFFFVFFLFQTLRLADFLIVHQLPIFMVSKIGLGLLLTFCPFVFPIAFLAASLSAFQRLSADSELTAMKASGMSMNRLMRPVLTFAAIVASASMLVFFELSPWAERAVSHEINNAGNQAALTALQSNTFIKEFFGLMMYAESSDPKTGNMKNVLIYDSREAENPLVITAPRGQLELVSTPSFLVKRRLLSLFNGQTLVPDPKNPTQSTFYFERYQIYLESVGSEASDPKTPRSYSTGKLLSIIRDPQTDVPGRRSSMTELFKRMNIALVPLIFAFVGAGLGVVRTRMSTGYAALITLVTALLYWELLAICVGWGGNGVLHPGIAMSLPNFLCIGLAALTYRRATW